MTASNHPAPDPGPARDADLLAGGGYARKQIFSTCRVIAFSHGARFRTARRLVTPLAGGRLLDYGCGDGTFLVLVRDLFHDAVGADVDPVQTEEAATRLGHEPTLRFVLTDRIAGAADTGAYDVVTCMETLEHCLAPDRRAVLADLRRLVSTNGRVVISVPIEIGPSVMLKHLVRTVAGWRRCGDYQHRERFRPRELLTMLCAGADTAIERPVYETTFAGARHRYHGHKGFNWRVLRRELDRAFVVEQQTFSPFPWLGPLLNSQVWFVCRPR